MTALLAAAMETFASGYNLILPLSPNRGDDSWGATDAMSW
jgi:hypothetical protein